MNDAKPDFTLPRRFAPEHRLGKGGGGEVWCVRDRVTGEALALKVLAEDAGEAEVLALVREAVTLSGLEGLGVPRVVAFGSLEGGRRYLVRELVDGVSLAEVAGLENDDGIRPAHGGRDWLGPIARAADQLTVLHRAGLLHGDIKPANVIVGDDGAATLVDLGLATPWREGGSRAKGLTPRYAAPELMYGEPLTVRAEIYSLGATLSDCIEARGDELPAAQRKALEAIATRATSGAPDARYPSTDEMAIAIRRACGFDATDFAEAAAWPVLGIDGVAQELFAKAESLGGGDALVVTGPRKSGRTTLLRRLSWSLGVSGAPVVHVEPPRLAGTGAAPAEAADVEEISHAKAGTVVIADDYDALPAPFRDALRVARERGARVIAVTDESAPFTLADAETYAVPPLDVKAATDIVARALPSLPGKLVTHLLDAVERRPGRLRSFVRRASGRPITSVEDVDLILAKETEPRAVAGASREEMRAELERALSRGRFDEADTRLAALGEPADDDEATTFAVGRAKISLARGDAAEAARTLDAAEARATRGGDVDRAWLIARARVHTRSGEFAQAAELAERGARDSRDALASDARAVRGVALAYMGRDDDARRELDVAVEIARELSDARAEAVALGSLAIAHQRAGRGRDARASYEAALAAAELAKDAWTIATTRLNLAGLAKADGDLALALGHLEAAVDMGRRAGGLVAVEQALFNLANVDLYLGRYGRAAASIDQLAEQRARLTPNARAQLLGLQAELATRSGDVDKGSRLYGLCADAYDAVARPHDAAEARLEGILARTGTASGHEPTADSSALTRELERVSAALGSGGFGEHEALACIVRGTLAQLDGDETRARAELDTAYESAMSAGHREWAWRALEARARLAVTQGAGALARRDIESALAMLEETASKLPRDLREVFWSDPRRRALRQAHAATVPNVASITQSFRGDLTPPTILARSGTTTSMGAPLPAEDRLARIFAITRDLASEHDLDRLLTRVTDHAVGLLGAERGLVVLVDEAGEFVAHTARDSKGEETHQTFSRSVAERVIREGEPVFAASAQDDARLAKAVSVHQLMIQSIACVPICGPPPAGRTIGALYVETRIRPGTRFRDELPTLAAFADQAAIAIEGARLLAENRRRTEELEIANEELRAAQAKLADALGRRTEQLAHARRDLKQARLELRSHFGYRGLVGTSAAMRKLYALIDRVKDADVPVLITGESGTGKEVVARAIHASGERARQPFLGVNCGAIPANLLESELFGHVRGAFTGAERDRKGLFREAERGSILLDEIGEMPLKMQAGLLRVLQEKTVRPVGGAKEEPCDARVIAATNRELEAMVAEGTFREDLYYRLHVVELKIPPLRERLDDLPALVDHFLSIFAARHKRERRTIERGALRRLQSYDWPGNVRQLEHVLLNAWLLAEGSELVADDFELPSTPLRPSVPPEARQPASARPRTEKEHRGAEKEQILEALEKSAWNRVQAAKLIGMPRRTFYRRLKDYGIV
ncbi:MAG: sigma 54-interacting transcriptional regulator [Myxococcales bacterium]|nr:sigma 54-interacting transcriptional regulator [Myxococcales bacterium]